MAIRHLSAFLALCLAALALAGCQDSQIPKAIRPVPHELSAKMQRLGMTETSPILIRLFKESSEVEVWKQRLDGRYALLKTYSICKWSGQLGPKVKEGDRQAPEGFYIVTPAQMNPNSAYYLSFNIGYPNAFDRALGRTGTNLMVHGACSSAGCYSMTDADAGELFALARDAFKGGQREFLIMAFPFRMTAENMAKHRDNPNMPFWQMLKVGYDHFEVTHQPPKVDVCNRTYIFNADSGGKPFDASAACPPYTVPEPIASAVAAKEAADDQKYAVAVAKFEAQEQKAAAAKQKAEEKAIADAQRAAERAAHPSLFARMLGAKPVPMPEPGAAAMPAPEPRASPADAGNAGQPEQVAVAAPLPRLKPAVPPGAGPSAEAGQAPSSPVKVAKVDAKKAAPANSAAKVIPVKAGPLKKAEPAATDPAPVAATAPLPDPIPTAGPPSDPNDTDTKSAATSAPGGVAPAAPPASAGATPAAPAQVGTFVKRKFIWPEDEDASASN